FSTENWNRPKTEVDAILRLLDKFAGEAEEEEEIEFHFIGDKGPLAPAMREHLEALERNTLGRSYVLNVALNYGGRAEIVHAVNAMLSEGKERITEADLSAHMYTAHCPEPDLVVRTGGELRISNFLLWQSAYAEYYFSDKMWPELTSDDVDDMVRSFAGRKRRWGGLDKA
ncbi:MAG: di-trans,poly-cis-decaprenylcistransferase, partial [Clostridia bacterium]|nr:di-trans,poly-cis-decaprenylcistransferase [Clostridia bacterium]